MVEIIWKEMFENYRHIHVSGNLVICCNFFSFKHINYFVTIFPIQMYSLANLTLPENRSRSTRDLHLYKLCRA